MSKRIHIFTGHFGSGKTEIALNYAINLAKSGKKTTIVDCDIVNTYFRTLDAKKELEKCNVKVIAPIFANTNLEMQMMTSEILSVFEDRESEVVFDVGGDEDGAFALGAYKKFFDREGYEMYFVVNTFRPLTQKCEDILVYMNEIENASRLNITHIVNNSNLAQDTNEQNLAHGDGEVRKICEKTQIDYAFLSGEKHVLDSVDLKKYGCDKKFYIERFLKPVF